MMIDQLEDNKMRRATKGQDFADVVLADWLVARTSAFEISNVRDLVGRVHWLQDGEVDVAKFPNVAPPFRSYWMEWHPGDREIGRLGCWCVITDGTDDEAWELAVAVWMDERKPRYVARARFRCPRDGSPITEVDPLVLFPESRLRQRRVAPRPDDILGAEMAARIEARVAAGEERAAVAHALADECRAKADEARQRVHELDTQILRLFTLPTLLMAHSLLACKNVGTEDHQADPKIRRAFRRRHGGRDRVVFKTLTITPAGGSGDRGERHDLGDGQTAMHLVRGHFKTFTPDRPLFGSRVGTWWWSPSVRGREEAGVVVKDYRIGSATR